MTEIRPFKAVMYNPEKAADLGKVMCPPYDVISSRQQAALYNASPLNFIRLLLPKPDTGDEKGVSAYQNAKKTFAQWLDDQILTVDEHPAVYYYRQEYKIMGSRKSRLGFISLMKIQDDEHARVYPHEKTHARAKEDRLRLWKALDTILSPIFVCFSDKDRKVEKVFLDSVSKTPACIDIQDQEGVRHMLWRLTDQDLISQITATLYGQQVFIADGHHRYEVAREVRRQKMEKNPSHNGEEDYNYTMTYFTNMDSRDLQIFPMHRIVKSFPDNMELLEEYFRIDRVKTKEELVVLLAKAGQNEHAFGLYKKDGMWLLRLKNKLLIDKIVTEGSAEFKHLDATILKYFIFDRVNIASEDIIYTKDLDDVTGMIDNGEAKAGFVMNPVRIQQLKNIALNGEKMPPKTTYFYPKLLSGLTAYKLS
ncbi:MAG: DUF1015 domain-containing protein [Candidatus Omnitrophota bacterium]